MSRSVPARLVLATRFARRDHLQGAWWPASRDLVLELPPLLAAAGHRLHGIYGVTLNREEWPDAPLLAQPLPVRSPTINWYGLAEAHLAVLHCVGGMRVTLLLLPPDTAEDVALTAMLMAATPGNDLSAAETLTWARDRAAADAGAVRGA